LFRGIRQTEKFLARRKQAHLAKVLEASKSMGPTSSQLVNVVREYLFKIDTALLQISLLQTPIEHS